MLALPLTSRPAAAFELFGFHLWGDKKTPDEVFADPVHYKVDLAVSTSDSDLEERITDASGLVRDEDRAVSGSLGLMVKARNDRELLVAALYEEGYYGGTVTVFIDGRNIDDLPPDATFDTSRTVPVRITVDPGPLFHLGQVRILSDAGDIDPAKYGLTTGAAARSGDILTAEQSILSDLRDAGHPLARIANRNVVADHATRTLAVTISVAAGPVAPLGEDTVSGTVDVDRDFVSWYADVPSGEIYSPERLRKVKKRLLQLEVFDSVTVAGADHLAPDGSLPITIDVDERKQRYFGVGVTGSTTDGAGIEGYWGHRNLFGRAEKLRVSGSVARIGKTTKLKNLDLTGSVAYTKPGFITPYTSLTTGLTGKLEHPDAYESRSVGVVLGLRHEIDERQVVTGGVGLEYSRDTDFYGTSSHLVASLPLSYSLDMSDDLLNPTEGYRLKLAATPAYDFKQTSGFVTLRGDAAGYLAVDDAKRAVLAARVAVGSIQGASRLNIPAHMRLYSGGGGSVRGYSYQAVGPRDPDNNPLGGRSLIEASLEARIQVTDTIGIVPFVDVGTVSASATPQFQDFQFGTGVGLRYLTPFGPLRIDVGVPLNRQHGDPYFGIYAGIGQAF